MAMYATSRDALAAMRDTLAGVLSDAANRADAAASIGADLFAVVDLLDTQRSLRTSLGDPSAPAEARRDLAQRLFGERIGSDAVALVTEAASRTWSRSSDLLGSLELLGREAYLKSAAERGDLDTVEDELFMVGRSIAATPELEMVLGDRAKPARAKQELLGSLIAGKVNAVTEALSQQAIGRLGDTKAADSMDALSDLAAGQRDRVVAKVRAAVELSPQQLDKLNQTLARIYDREVVVHSEVDMDLLSGLVIQVGDEVIDGSGAGRLATIRRSLS